MRACSCRGVPFPHATLALLSLLMLSVTRTGNAAERGTQVVRTHLLCAYPMTARYNGTGSTDDAAALICR